jgi:hypothetical protein
MDNLTAFSMGARHRHNPMKVFDWARAATLIKEHKPVCARAGLAGDWENTGGTIYRDGAPVPEDETYIYLASTWATPELDLDGEVVPCYIMESEVPWGWGDNYAKIYWPEQALNVLLGKMRNRAWQKAIRKLVKNMAANSARANPHVYRNLSPKEVQEWTKKVCAEMTGLAQRPVRLDTHKEGPNFVWSPSLGHYVVTAP